MKLALEDKDADVDPDLLGWFREYQFRKSFGGSHQDFMAQPRLVTEWLLAIDSTVNGVQSG